MEGLILDFMRLVLGYIQKHGDVQSCEAAGRLLARLTDEEKSMAEWRGAARNPPVALTMEELPRAGEDSAFMGAVEELSGAQ